MSATTPTLEEKATHIADILPAAAREYQGSLPDPVEEAMVQAGSVLRDLLAENKRLKTEERRLREQLTDILAAARAALSPGGDDA